MNKTFVKNIGLLCTPTGSRVHAGAEQGQITKIENACALIEDGKITYCGPQAEAPAGAEQGAQIVDAQGRLVTPGLIDAHTHLVFGGWRQHEIPLKLAGAGYLDILRMGGGILSTVKHTREETEDQLYAKSLGFVHEMLAMGVTACEMKSGYGLNTETELKQLRVIRRLAESSPMDVASTFLGAHAVPEEYKDDADGYVDQMIRETLPAVAEQKLAQYCDVFCETGVFDVEQSRRVLEAGKALGLKPRIHADEIDAIGGAQLAGQVGAVSAEHLIAADEDGMAALAKGGVIADLLPATSFYLDKTFAPVRRMVELGIPVVIASDFNPGSCPSLNLPFAMNLGLLRYKLTPEEVLTAVTINAACSIGMEDRLGSLETGKQGDLVIWDAPDWEMLLYRFGSNLCHTVIKAGQPLAR